VNNCKFIYTVASGGSAGNSTRLEDDSGTNAYIDIAAEL